MSSSPSDPADLTGQENYQQAWGRLVGAVRAGESWSGSEVNRFFTNAGNGTFTDTSLGSGLDFADDGRAMAFCDWDRDGDLDIWHRNRTAPRLRLMINRGTKANTLMLRLEGTSCNRDAIGAVVEVVAGGQLQLRSVTAGDMFLSQSSKWLHFGLQDGGKIERVVVQWPGGQRESFTGGAGSGRFIATQGNGKLRLAEGPPALALAEQPASIPSPGALAGNILLPAALQLPRLQYRNAAAQAVELQPTGRMQVLLVWNSSDPISVQNLKAAHRQKEALAKAGLKLLALSSDELTTAGAAYEAVDALGSELPWGFLDPASAEVLWRWQAALFDRKPASAAPLALLIGGAGRTLAIYRGMLDAERIAADATRIKNMTAKQRWHAAPPFAGSWFTNPLPEDQLRALISAGIKAGG